MYILRLDVSDRKIGVSLLDPSFINEAQGPFDSAEITQKRKPYFDVVASQMILQGYPDAGKAQ
jgi:RNase H-fold protein (predicted Holliday junction resolvase)